MRPRPGCRNLSHNRPSTGIDRTRKTFLICDMALPGIDNLAACLTKQFPSTEKNETQGRSSLFFACTYQFNRYRKAAHALVGGLPKLLRLSQIFSNVARWLQRYAGNPEVAC